MLPSGLDSLFRHTPQHFILYCPSPIEISHNVTFAFFIKTECIFLPHSHTRRERHTAIISQEQSTKIHSPNYSQFLHSLVPQLSIIIILSFPNLPPSALNAPTFILKVLTKPTRKLLTNDSSEVEAQTFREKAIPEEDGLSSKINKNKSCCCNPSSFGVRWNLRWTLREKLAGILLVILVLAADTEATYKLKPRTTVSLVSLAGHTARLPCQLPLPGDRPTLILWYKDDATKPFYSYDGRDAVGQHKVHDDSHLGHRSSFTLFTTHNNNNLQSGVGYLSVKDLVLGDAGNYICRVDFVNSQTMMALLQLSVHEEIDRLEILDGSGKSVDKVAGPYQLSSRVVLVCRSHGGYPSPVVWWVTGEGDGDHKVWQQQQQLSQSASSFTTQQSVSVSLDLPSLTRQDHGRHLTCVASNTNLTQHCSKMVTIDMYLPPLEVELSGVEGPLRAGVVAPVVCRSKGSRPPAELSWDMNGSQGFTTLPPQTSLDGNTTTRRGRLVPTAEDNGRSIFCIATNPTVQSYTRVTAHTLQVHYWPQVSIVLAPALDPGNIREGEDVYFECHIKANPRESRVLWLHKGNILESNKSTGVLAQGRNLVLQRVSRHAHGDYQCRVTNIIATVTSTPVTLNVMFAPECIDPHTSREFVTDDQDVSLRCVLEANPEQVNFIWRANSRKGVRKLPLSWYITEGRTSTLLYRHQHNNNNNTSAAQQSQHHYAVVYCMGSNKMGTQKVPCKFIITSAGPPDVPVSCRLVNHSAFSLTVACQPGHNGGLQQHFVTTVKDSSSGTVVAEVSSPEPTFTVRGLTPGRDYLLLVSAVNNKGASPPIVIHGPALKVAENKINDSGLAETSSLLSVLVVTLSGSIFLLTVVVVAATCYRYHRRKRRRMIPQNDTETTENILEDSNQAPASAPASPPTKASIDDLADGDGEEEEDNTNTPDMLDGPLVPLNVTTQSIVRASSSSKGQTYYAKPVVQQPLHSIDLPQTTSNNHNYYNIKINNTRLNNETFV